MVTPTQLHKRCVSLTAEAETVITADQGVRGGKIIELKQTVDEAVAKCPGVRRVFMAQRTGAQVAQGKLDIPLEQVRDRCDCQ